jgi:hypothetical protein
VNVHLLQKVKKKGKILSQGLHQRSKMAALSHSQKQGQFRGLRVALTATLGLGFENIKLRVEI